MHNSQILIFSAVMAFLALRLYQKYFKKDKNKSGAESNPNAGTAFPSSSKDEEYEPYSKK